MVVPRNFPEAFLVSALAAMTLTSEEIVILDPVLRARAEARAGSRRRRMTKKAIVDGPISPHLRRRRQDLGGD